MDKHQLINTLHVERAAWGALLKEVGEERMTAPGVVGDWSIKDIIAHITAWQRRPVEWLAAARRGDKPTPPPWPASLSGDDPINAWIFDANRKRPLKDVLLESRQAHDQMMKGLESISDEDLNDASRFSWLKGNTLADSIPGNSYEHYQHHTQDIQAWLKMERV
jgi:hypothetical protein